MVVGEVTGLTEDYRGAVHAAPRSAHPPSRLPHTRRPASWMLRIIGFFVE